jgi:WhiB family transcriptional regulator, redox-sensing transcriptional regulator
MSRLPLHDALAALEPFAGLSDESLSESVVEQGTCMALYAQGRGPTLTGDPIADRRMTEPWCLSCPVRRECLEWEMRSVGPATRGPWGLLHEPARRDFYELWAKHRGIQVEIPDGLRPGQSGGDR